MIKRELEVTIKNLASHFPVVAILGPRQSGKTTTARQLFSTYSYVSLEDYDVREKAERDPRAFLKTYDAREGLILDEIQNVPQLLSYMQTIVDNEQRPGRFIITGSQNILVNEAVTQTLAGRIGLVRLFPLSLAELEASHTMPQRFDTALFNGFYPRIYANAIPPETFYKNYIDTYLERDVRQIKNIVDLRTFQRFIQLCAGRAGQLLNISSLSNDCGIDQKTVRGWLSILEATYIIFLLEPYYKNFGKRLIKAPKLYFVDTGLVCSLLEIRNDKDLFNHYMRGALFENMIIADFYKQYHNLDIRPPLYFWRDAKTEVDCIVDQALHMVPIEIKSGATINMDFFKQLTEWRSAAGVRERGYVVYGGDQSQSWTENEVVSWQSAGSLIRHLEKK